MRWTSIGFAMGACLGIPSAFDMLAAGASRAPAQAHSEILDQPIVEEDPADRSGRITIPRAPDGFFYVTISSGDRDLPCLVDTGATTLTLSAASADRLGLASGTLRYDGRVQGSTGAARAAEGLIDRLEIAGQTLDHVDAVVTRGNAMSCLIGQQLLRRLGPIHVEKDELRLG